MTHEAGDARKVVCRAPNWGLTPDGRCTVCGNHPAAPAQAEPREQSMAATPAVQGRQSVPSATEQSVVAAAPAAQEGCPRCGKVTREDDIHTCSPQDGRDLDALIAAARKWEMPMRETSHWRGCYQLHSRCMIAALTDALAALRAREQAQQAEIRTLRNAAVTVTEENERLRTALREALDHASSLRDFVAEGGSIGMVGARNAVHEADAAMDRLFPLTRAALGDSK